MTRSEIESWFPNMQGKPFIIVDADTKFNCIAYTLEIYDEWIWTNESWPYNQIPRNPTVEGFKKLYIMHGYEECNSKEYEPGYEKIAFYSKNGSPTHAAKQFKNIWRSKLGNKCIIEHELEWICGNTEDAYGEIAFIMQRKII